MGKSPPSVPLDQVDVRRQKVRVGSGEDVSDSGGNLPFSPSRSLPLR